MKFQSLDRYELVRVLGEGSSARTLLCTDLSEDRPVALKELRFSHVENWKYLELFEREARMLAMLDHPGIPKIFDFFQGTGASTTLYIVQEYVEGKSLQERMDSGPMLGQDEIREVALGMLDVLEYLHGRSPPVLHRDIKPSNVLLRPGGVPTLIDFGGVCFGWRPPETAGTTIIGTFGYMPPEQFVGQGGPTADLYSLAATLLHLVTGRAPSEFSFDSGRIEVPDDLPAAPPLVRLIEALLRTAPRDRPASAAAAREVLLGSSADVARSTPGGIPAATAATRAQVVVHSGDGPRFVDLGEPPRDLHGEFADVYRNLINPLLPARSMRSAGGELRFIALALLGAVVTAGITPAIYAWRWKSRRSAFSDLFREGRFVEGVIRTVDKGETFATFRYEYEADGSTYSAFLDYPKEMARYWGPGSVVPVLYDPQDPTRSCFVYR